MEHPVKPKFFRECTVHFPLTNERTPTNIHATARNGAGISSNMPTKPAPIALPPPDVAKLINTKKRPISATKKKASLDASPKLLLRPAPTSSALSHCARLNAISFPFSRTGAEQSSQISVLAGFDASQTRHCQTYWGIFGLTLTLPGTGPLPRSCSPRSHVCAEQPDILHLLSDL